MRYVTAGESHNKGLIAVVEDFPAGVEINQDLVNYELSLRQGGYGRGGRMKIEKDQGEIISGIRQGKSIGSPISIFIKNKDWDNYKDRYHKEKLEYNTPRPGHADLAGMLKYGFEDCRDVLERASARETAAKVAAGSLFQQLLKPFGIEVHSYVTKLGNIHIEPKESFVKVYDSKFYTLDISQDKRLVEMVDEVKGMGDTLGGVVETVITGVPPGLGSYTQHNHRLDSQLGFHILSIPSVKGVEFGLGFEGATVLGSNYHDTMSYNDSVFRERNNAGGIEGGMSNGENIVVRCAIKPIPTVKKGMATFNVASKENCINDYQRSDVTVVPAASVVVKNVVAFVIAKNIKDKFGGDHVKDTLLSYQSYLKNIGEYYHGDKFKGR